MKNMQNISVYKYISNLHVHVYFYIDIFGSKILERFHFKSHTKWLFLLEHAKEKDTKDLQKPWTETHKKN